MRTFTIRETSQRILNPFTPEKLATLGDALHLRAGQTILDLACGKGELLCTWARDHGTAGVGVDVNPVNTQAASARAAQLGVADRLTFIEANAVGFVADTPVDVAACIGATWIGDGVAGTVELLRRSVRPDGLLLIGEPFWRLDPPDLETVHGCWASSKEDFRSLPDLVRLFGELGWDLVEMVLADQDSWDRYSASQWFNIRTWLDANPEHELAAQLREELTTAPVRYVRYGREYLGWGVFALKQR
ncbi:class I SAM-dependent methyltransferase [Luedemannella helvata]